ncbi:hypothetical protein POTOM_022162 [Populus tomentosa]|uniref:Uncharacterized protein n=1 Tax=Populus tomentosa TaxID=118781 RepID=A0A8X7ZT84_POPTO|nr:hypothetical protein POTOM_022162 [Populus tomentosa]
MRGELFLFNSCSSVSGGALLIALVAGDAAVEYETMSPVESVKRVLVILRGVFHPKGIFVPDPVQYSLEKRLLDILILLSCCSGSYSYVADGSSGDDYDSCWECGGWKSFLCKRGNQRTESSNNAWSFSQLDDESS